MQIIRFMLLFLEQQWIFWSWFSDNPIAVERFFVVKAGADLFCRDCLSKGKLRFVVLSGLNAYFIPSSPWNYLCRALKMEEGGNKILVLTIVIGRQSLNILLLSNSNF